MRAVVKVRKRTREVVATYDSASEAARENDMAVSSVMHTTRGLTLGEFYFRYEEDFDPCEDFTGMRNCPVIVRDEKTGQAAWYCDATTASEKLGIPRHSIYQSIQGRAKAKRRFVFAYYGKRIV